MLALFGMSQAAAQEYGYVPFVREGVKWICECVNWGYDDKYDCTLELKGDREIDGKTYKAMHKYTGDEINWEDDTVLVYLREQDKVVYGIVPDGKLYPDYPIGVESDEEMMDNINNGREFVLYDFSNPVEFLEKWTSSIFNPRSVVADETTVGGRKAKRYISYYQSSFCAIEGIGYDGLWGWYPLGFDHGSLRRLSHVIEDGEVIYRSEKHNSAFREQFQPLWREGVQWVNERVVIDRGDTTRYYYTYEFKGSTLKRHHPILYRYESEVLDTTQAEVIAKFQTNSLSYDSDQRICMIYDNVPFTEVMAEGRDLIGYGSSQPGCLPIYRFAESNSEIDTSSPAFYYIINQKEEFLNRYNFYEVDPLFIDGIECKRYCYVDEEGNPQAYITEGIGFDSYDMGDLLTPFTRRPDPNADHQEYWGLSHVIKDGKIIYKGLRYHGGIIGDGDVNGDGVVNIADVTAMITLLMHGNGRYNKSGDMDGSGANNIADLTMLISGLLTGSDTAK